MFKNDYIMREIENLSKFLATVLFHKKFDPVEMLGQQGFNSNDPTAKRVYTSLEGEFLNRLLKMVENGEINDAEDKLFERVEEEKSEPMLAVALEFYNCLSLLPKERLESCDYSHEEIAEGLNAIKDIYIITE